MSIVEPKRSARIADCAFRGPAERRRRPRPFRTAPVAVPRRKPQAAEVAPPPKSAVHQMSLLFVWLAIFSSFFVVREPAPVDALMMGLIVLLPVVGLTAFNSAHLTYLIAWASVMATGLIAAILADYDWAAAATHIGVSIYLVMTSFVIAGFVARSPEAHSTLLFNAFVAAALIAAITGTIGYFDLIPGANDWFTVHQRAAGSFKDPNVFAPFLVPPFLYLLHEALTRKPVRAALALAGLAILGTGLLLSFSRGAWVNLLVAIAVYGVLSFVTVRTDHQRLKLIGIGIVGASLLAAVVALAFTNDEFMRAFEQRFTLAQSYDQGPEGRFGGQGKAIDILLEHPFGFGALQFGGYIHAEHPHNVYISQFLNGGWLGGCLYIAIIAAGLVYGLRAVLRRTWPSRTLLVVYACFAGLVVEGFVVETDHWRTFYLVLGMLFGLVFPSAKLDVHIAETGRPNLPVSLATMPMQAPTRAARIIGPAPSRVEPPIKPKTRRRRAKRQARILFH